MATSQQYDPSPDDDQLHSKIDGRLQYLLDDIVQKIPVEIACIFSQTRDSNHLTNVAIWHSSAVSSDAIDSACTLVKNRLNSLANEVTEQIPIRLDIGESKSLYSALLWPLAIYDSLVGVIALFSSKPGFFEDIDIAPLDPIISLVRAVLEHYHLSDRLVTTRAIASTAQAIAQDPSPQNIVNLLRENLFTPRVSSCWISLFGPVYEDRPNAPYEYLELQGSWSRNLGNHFAVGTRTPIDLFPDTMVALYEHKVLTIFDVRERINSHEGDPLIKVMFEADQVQSITLLLLESDSRRLGVLGIGTDDAYPFSPHELRSYQIVAEFLTMSTMASALQRHANIVQEGRAALLDAVTDGVIMVLPDNEASVLTINEQFSLMFGVNAEYTRGISLIELLEQMRIPNGVRRDLHKRWSALPPHSPERLSGEFRMSGPQLAASDIQWYSAPVYQNGAVLGRIYTFHDITPERMSQRLRSELLSRISHELRTPLTSIRGFAEFILETTGDELPPIAREYTEIIHHSAQHLNRLFTDMIELTRANAGEMKLQRMDARLQDTIIEVVARLEPQYHTRGQRVIMDLDDELPPVLIDVDRISQVITNILNNAIKYSPENSTIRVTTTRIDHFEDLPDDAPIETITPCITVMICDQGPGFTRAEADKIFLPFYRTESTQAQKVEGAGLGLSIAQSIVLLHEGQIWAIAATRRDPGGRFIFTLPIQLTHQ